MGCFGAHQLPCGEESTTLPAQRYVGQRSKILRAARNILSSGKRITLVRYVTVSKTNDQLIKGTHLGAPAAEQALGSIMLARGRTLGSARATRSYLALR
jgi:hypothetical protein